MKTLFLFPEYILIQIFDVIEFEYGVYDSQADCKLQSDLNLNLQIPLFLHLKLAKIPTNTKYALQYLNLSILGNMYILFDFRHSRILSIDSPFLGLELIYSKKNCIRRL